MSSKWYHRSWLTRQQRVVICFTVGLLLLGWAVKHYRATHPEEVVVVKELER